LSAGDEASAIPSSLPRPKARLKQGPFPPRGYSSSLHRYFDPLGLPLGTGAFRLRLIATAIPLKGAKEDLSCSAVRCPLVPSPLPRGESCGSSSPRLVHSSRAPQSFAFAVTCSARPPTALSGGYSNGMSSGVHFRYGPKGRSLLSEALVTPLSTRNFAPAPGSATRRPLDLPWRDSHPQVDSSFAGHAIYPSIPPSGPGRLAERDSGP